MKIIIDYIHPPIPTRDHDYHAHFDDPEGLRGWGATRLDAITDLLTQWEEMK